MLHLDIDGVIPSARHFDALGIGIDARSKTRAVVIDRLAVFPQLDRLVDTARLVVPVHRRGLDVAVCQATIADWYGAARRTGPAALGFSLSRRLREARGCAARRSQAAASALLECQGI